MGEPDIQLTYYLNYPRLAKVTDNRDKAANVLASSIISNYIQKSAGMLEWPLSTNYNVLYKVITCFFI